MIYILKALSTLVSGKFVQIKYFQINLPGQGKGSKM